MLPDGEVFLMVWLAFVAEEGPTALASFCSTTAVRCDGAGFLIRCRTHPLLAAAIICCPNSCAFSAGNTIDSNPSSARIICHFSGANPGLPGRRISISSCNHQPSNKPNVKCVNSDQVLISLSSRIPRFFNAALAFRTVSLMSGVACNTLAAMTKSYWFVAIDCDANGLVMSKIDVIRAEN